MLQLIRGKRLNRAKTNANSTFCVTSFGGNIRTKTDSLYDMGISSEAACVTRQYGMIAHAEHFGRLA